MRQSSQLKDLAQVEPTQPRVAVVVVFHNGLDETIACLESVMELTYPIADITVVDDGSTDGSHAAISAKYPEIHIVRGDGNLWCNASFNAGIMHPATRASDLVLLLNNDNVIAPDGLGRLVDTFQRFRPCIVGSMVSSLQRPDEVSYAGCRMNWRGGDLELLHTREVLDEVPAGPALVDVLGFQGVLIPLSILQALGLIDSRAFKQYCGDVDFYLRASRAGYPVLVDTRSVVWENQPTKGPGGPDPRPWVFLHNLVSVRSPVFVLARYRLYRRHAPKGWLPPMLAYYGLLGVRQARVMAKSLLRPRDADVGLFQVRPKRREDRQP